MQNVECGIKESRGRRSIYWQLRFRHVSSYIPRSSFCILHSTFCLSSRSGQAMIEFTIALVAIMAVVIGTILLGRMELVHTRTMTKARETAGLLALDPIYRGPIDAQFISDWQAGVDNVGYTHDDEPIPDGTAITLVGDITANSGLDGIAPTPNAISRLQSFPDISEFYLVKGSESESVCLCAIPGIGRLISGEPVISVESKSWLVWTGGIY